jgi:hypothetical protein
MPSTSWRSVQTAIWIGFLGGYTASGLAVATTSVGGLGATVTFLAGFLAIGGVIFERRHRLIESSDVEGPPSPWDGSAWEGWLMLAGRVVAGLVVIRILMTVEWGAEWTQIFWRIDS